MKDLIIVAEDEKGVRELICEMLECLGYQAQGYSDAEAAYGAVHLREGNIELLLTDVAIPMIGGFELVRMVRKEFPRVPVVFMSGHSDNLILSYMLKNLKDPFLSKPFLSKDLAAKIREAKR